MKTIITILFFISSFMIFSCRSNDSFDNSTLLLDQSIMIDGLEREYHIQTPVETENKPIVILLHGHGGSSDQSLGQEFSKNPQKIWLEVAEENDFIVVAPNGVLGPEDTRGWNDCRNDAQGNPETDDVAFISELLEKLHVELEYDLDRVYVTGVSNGASMSIRIAQEIPEKIAAFAAIVNSMPGNSECPESEVPVSALFMNGTGDLFVPYEGGQILSNRGLVQSTEESIDYWINRNNTDTTAITETFPDLNQNDNSIVEKYVYPNGTNDTEVVFYKVVGGGHTEPSLSERYSNIYLEIVGEQNGDIEMADEVWDFFKTKSN